MPAVTLPDLGEGVESGTIVSVLVSPGDEVKSQQGLMEIELDKATVELPSPQAGRVAEILVKAGDTVKKGQELLVLEGDGAGAKPGKSEKKAERKAEPEQKAEPEKKAEAKPEQRAQPQAPKAVARAEGAPIPAGPAARKLARHLGVDLSHVAGTGQRGRITLEDVAGAAKGQGAVGGGGGGVALPALPDFSQWGEVTREPLSGIRKKTAESMSRSWSTIPAVTHHDLADITDLEAGRKAFREANKEAKVTMTVILLKAVVQALRAFPSFNASLDLAKNELITKKFFHIGVAVDTEHGLLVPVVRDVDKKSILALSKELDELAAKARAKKLGLDDMRGATFTVSNLGGIGGIGFSPIVNWPEVAILGVSRAREQFVPGPDGKPVARLLMPLSLSYDHRLIDGASAARFVKLLCDLLARPIDLLFHA